MGEPYRAIVKCPFCEARVDSRELADHARLNHVTGRKEGPEACSQNHPVLKRKALLAPTYTPDQGHSVYDESDWIESSLTGKTEKTGMVTIRAHLVKGESGDTESRIVWCPFCSVGLKPGRLQKHLEKSHPVVADCGRKVKAASRKTPERSSFMQCPVCNALINKTSLQEHLVDVHSMEIQLGKSGPRLILPMAERADDWILSGMILCPLCKAKHPRQNLGQHLECAHPEIKLLRARVHIVDTSPAH